MKHVKKETEKQHEQVTTDDNYFGVCPECGKSDGFLNVGRNHFFVCHEHKVCWFVGSNLFRCWREQDDKTFRQNEELLKTYRCIPCSDARAPSGEFTPGVVTVERPSRYGSIDGLDDDELADPQELERIAMLELHQPLLQFRKRQRFAFWSLLDEQGNVFWRPFDL